MTFEIGKKIRLLRLSRGMTQEQLAEKLCVTAQSVSKWENCITAPDISALPQLSVVLGVTIDELFSMTDDTRLSRIENMLETSSENTVIPEREFESCRSFLTEHKDDPALKGRVLTMLACLYNQQAAGYRMTAAEYAKEAIAYEPEKKYNHSQLCLAWNGADRDWYASNHGELIAFYLDFIEKHTNNVPAFQLLLDNLIADGRTDEAEVILEKLKKTDDSCRGLWYEAQIYRLRGNNERASEAIDRMTEAFPDDWLAWSYKGDYYARVAEYEKADECWERSHSLQTAPRLTDDLLSLAQTATIRKEYSRAAELYLRTIELLEADYGTTEGDMITQLKALSDMYSAMGG